MSERIVLSPTPGSVAVARRWSAEAMHRADLDDLSDTVALLVSELVSNVVLHARTECELVVLLEDGRVRVEVRDGSDHLPGPTIQTDPLALSGRGMLLVQAMSSANGSEAIEGGGKLVWFEIEKPADATP